MCTLLLPQGVNPIAVDKYIISTQAVDATQPFGQWVPVACSLVSTCQGMKLPIHLQLTMHGTLSPYAFKGRTDCTFLFLSVCIIERVKFVNLGARQTYSAHPQIHNDAYL
jgi:hypothetical protein